MGKMFSDINSSNVFLVRQKAKEIKTKGKRDKNKKKQMGPNQT